MRDGRSRCARAALAWLLGTLGLACGVLPNFNATIDVSGTVRGEDGRPLGGVVLDARASRFDLASESFSSKAESRFELREGRFAFSCRSCSGAVLHFSRDGYYSETLRLAVEKQVEGTGRLASEAAQNLRRDDLEIVLRSAANQVQLVRYEAFVQSAADGPRRVAALRRDLGSRGVAFDRLDAPPSREARYLPGYVQLLAAVDADGALAAEPLPDVPGARMRFPMPPTLDFGPAGGGVVVHRHAGGNPAEVYREMRTAPKDGYVDALVLDPPARGDVTYFYFRVGDRYGKGRAVSPSFDQEDGEEVVAAYVELRLNPTGDRNVETSR